MTLKELYDEVKTKVSLDRFNPVEKIAYGLVTLICSAVIIALLTLIIRKW